MKVTVFAAIAASLFSSAFAAVETWTNKEGKSVQMELVSVTEVYGRLVGDFRLSDGRVVKVGAIDLIDADARRLVAAKQQLPSFGTASTSPAAPSPGGNNAFFDKALDGNLVKLEGKSLKRINSFVKPTNYYLFYYTASWCGPCQKFTPSLLEFYKAKKNAEFEVVLITSDSEEDAMKEYSVEKQMPWPQLKFSRADNFKKEFKHPGRGIPNLVLTDLQGNLIKTSYVDGKYIGPAAVMNHLATLLTK